MGRLGVPPTTTRPTRPARPTASGATGRLAYGPSNYCAGGTMDRTSPNPTTLESLHALAEHVVAAALYAETGRIGLRVASGGFSTPPFADDSRTVGVDHGDLVGASADG